MMVLAPEGEMIFVSLEGLAFLDLMFSRHGLSEIDMSQFDGEPDRGAPRHGTLVEQVGLATFDELARLLLRF